MFPDDPKEALNQIQTLEKTLSNSDPRTAQRKIMQEALEALQQFRRSGVSPHESWFRTDFVSNGFTSACGVEFP
jgi:hypothetical protein